MTDYNTSITEKAHAKINLSLDIKGRRPDGYHLLRMVMQTLSLADDVTVTPREKDFGIRTFTSDPDIADDESNLACKAASRISRRLGYGGGLEIRIEKHIPAAAGLAGGSSDAAAVLRAVSRLIGRRAALSGTDSAAEDSELRSTGASGEQADSDFLREIGLSIGADVPYCVEGGTMLSEGIGERLTRIEPPFPVTHVLLIKPEGGVSTKDIYEAYDSLPSFGIRHPDTDDVIRAVRSGDLESLSLSMGNVLEDVTRARVKDIARINDFLAANGNRVHMMSGSGPTVFTLSRDGDEIARLAGMAKDMFPGAEVICTETWNPPRST